MSKDRASWIDYFFATLLVILGALIGIVICVTVLASRVEAQETRLEVDVDTIHNGQDWVPVDVIELTEQRSGFAKDGAQLPNPNHRFVTAWESVDEEAAQ